MVFKVISFIILTITVTHAQETSRCDFSLMHGEYRCRLDNMNVATENDFVNLSGNHMGDRTDTDVTRVTFNHGRMLTAFPTMVFDRFPNLDMIFVTGNLNVNNFVIRRCERIRIFSFEGPANAVTRLFNGLFTNCVIMEEFLMQRTSVTHIEVDVFQGTPNLRRIVIPRNQILNFPAGIFRNLPHLEHLDIERNNIISFEPQIFQGLIGVRHIQCGQLQNRNWPAGLFTNLPNLNVIDVNWSGLQTIETGVFGNLPNLEIIRIYGELRRLSGSIFSGTLPRLHTLNINRNQINAVQSTFFNNLPALRTVTATFNLCVNQDLNDVSSVQPILEAFQQCFSNY